MKINYNIDFVMPTELLIKAAKKGRYSSNDDIRAVSSALLDVTSEATKVQKQMLKKGNVDLGPFFDFWFVDAIECANRLLNHEDEMVRNIAECLIESERSIAKSKESFLLEMKRVGLKPEHDDE